jgi:hypothetical protein
VDPDDICFGPSIALERWACVSWEREVWEWGVEGVEEAMTVRLCLGARRGENVVVPTAAVLVTSEAFRRRDIKRYVVCASKMWGQKYLEAFLSAPCNGVYFEAELEIRSMDQIGQDSVFWPLDLTVTLGSEVITISPYLQPGVREGLLGVLKPALGSLADTIIITDLGQIVQEILESVIDAEENGWELGYKAVPLSEKGDDVKAEIHRLLRTTHPLPRKGVICLSYETAKLMEVRELATPLLSNPWLLAGHRTTGWTSRCRPRSRCWCGWCSSERARRGPLGAAGRSRSCGHRSWARTLPASTGFATRLSGRSQEGRGTCLNGGTT